MTTYYVVFIYCDYRKEVDIQHLKVYLNREDAIEFAKKYTSRQLSEPEYVGPCGTEYDAPFLEEHYEEEACQQARDELKIKPDMWYLRIAVSRVDS